MKSDITLPSKAEVENATKEHSWILGNQVLYDMCHNYPSQSDPTAVVSKFWLIGRAYSAALERRRTSQEEPLRKGENFYDHRFVPVYTQGGFDALFAPLYNYEDITEHNIAHIVQVHCSLTKVLQAVTGQWKRSLASKYLHFHFPKLFFIYDSQADTNLRKYIPQWTRYRIADSSDADKYYLKFCRGVMLLRETIISGYDIKLTPRDMDNLLLAAIEDR